MGSKKNIILIILGITLLFFGCLIFWKNYNVQDDETILLEEQIKKQITEIVAEKVTFLSSKRQEEAE